MADSGGEKTEQPTPKRLQDARKKGQVAKSQDLTSAALLVAAVGVLAFFGASASQTLIKSLDYTFHFAGGLKGEMDSAVVFGALTEGVKTLGVTLAPLFVTLFALALGVSYVQVGSLFAPESIKPDVNKLNPVEAFKNKFFKSRSYIELAKNIVKIVVAAAIIWFAMKGAIRQVLALTAQPIEVVAVFTTRLAVEIGLKVACAFIAIGAVDFFLQRFLHLKEMRMSKKEVMDEFKESEGDPHVKGHRKQLHREILHESMAAAVKNANVVVVNPTHVAVALQYDREKMQAPQIVAKGMDLMAAQIRKIAEESKVPIMRDVPLARTLHELEIEQEIPEDLYEAVAVVLRWSYQFADESRVQRP
jgi:flagellar biosynthesis protein FlhB